MDAKEYSRQVKAEADKLLKETHLAELLGQFGKVKLGGSYSYNLMVDRDLDFGVAVSGVTPDLRAEIAATFAKQPWAYGVTINDRINFEPLSNLQAPRGLFLGLTIPFLKNRWNVDVWFTVGPDLPPDELAEQILKASEEQKSTILAIKYALMQSGDKVKGVTSAAVYEAVLTNSALTPEEFLNLS